MNATDMAAHRLAGEPGALAGSPSVPFPGFEPGRHPPEGCGSTVGLEGLASGYRASDPRPSPWQGDALPLRHIRMEPARGIGPRLPPYHGDVLPLSLSRRELGKRDSDAHLVASKAEGCQLPHSPSEPPPSATLGCRSYKERPVVGPEGRGVPGGIRTRNLQALDLAPLPIGLQAHGAATRCRPGSPAVRERGRSRARRRSWPILASNQETLGSEPRRAAKFPQWPSVRKARFERTYREV